MLNIFGSKKEPPQEVCQYAFERTASIFQWIGRFELIKLSAIHRFRIAPSWQKSVDGYELSNRKRNYEDFREALLLGRYSKPFERDWSLRLWSAIAAPEAPITHWFIFEYYSCTHRRRRVIYVLPLCIAIANVDSQSLVRNIGKYMVSRFAGINELAQSQTIWYLLESKHAEAFWIAQLFAEIEAQARSLERQLQTDDIIDLWRKF